MVTNHAVTSSAARKLNQSFLVENAIYADMVGDDRGPFNSREAVSLGLGGYRTLPQRASDEANG